MMELREMSDSTNNIEKDENLSKASAQAAEEKEIEKVEETSSQTEAKAEVVAESEPAPAEEPVQEQPVNDTPQEPETSSNEVPEAEASQVEPVVAPPVAELASMDKSQLIAKLKEISESPIESIKDEVNAVKTAFYAIRKDETAKQMEAFVAAGNQAEAFEPAPDQAEEEFKELLNVIKERKAEYLAQQQAEKEENLNKKRAIIQQIKEITDDPDNINRQFNKVQQLQQDFKSVGPVPPTAETEVWKVYQQEVEKFYDLLKINKELRDYDFKKNLEIKQRLCTEAEALDEEPDIVAAFKKLQELHSTWRETGPVAKELREDLWMRFKNASSVINKKYQAHFEERKAKERENAEAKTALCEQVEAISIDELKSFSAWDEATKKIIDIQQEWKKLGLASRKLNSELFARFRKTCDEFFAQKAAFFKTMKEGMAANLAKKEALCEKAEELKDSTEWRKATEAFVALQKEWKTIGPVAKKQSDIVWKRFIAACDYFFEQRKKQHANTHSVEHENLSTKKAIIAKLNAILEAEETDDAPQQVRDLMAQWQTVGHVPFKEKDKIYAAYREAIDKAFEKFDMKGTRAHLANYENSLSKIDSSDKAYHERERLVREYEKKCSELKTYENNMGFFTLKSANASSLMKEMERKIARLKEDIDMLEQKIKMLDEKI